MSLELLLFMLASEAISLFLIVRLWSGGGSNAYRTLVTVLTFIPFVGPIFYLFITDQTPPQPLDLQNRGPRGEYFQRWISLKPEFERELSELKEQAGEQHGHDT